ncbi:hypothetical protein J4E90_005017 [Alternaria incomplexa]|uniref:uncharacterized protein n=1 Tax=Alternaria incomplexa TaxID=1187928 RepID=UPI0022206EDF|nr:uncharacterized protein J4E90_005017 [Alternaria incomplexa]KAI4914980.1 hypothetical protein J4E90_005017 [Alternaria incomplexa]
MASQNSNPNADPVFFGGIEVDITQFDFSDHTSKVNSLTITCAVFIALVVLTVGLRLFARAKYVGHIFIDDFLIICAAVFTVALAAVCIAGKQQIAIISSYLRFIHDKTFRIWMYAISVCIVGLWISGIFVTIFQCRPVQGAWNFTLEPVCVDYVTYLYASSAVNVATDLLLCALPIPHIWRLNMPKRQRIVLCVLLAGGASASILGIVRIAFLDRLRVLDVTYQSVECVIMSVGECSLGIISVSIAALRPMARQFFPNAMRNSPSSSSKPREAGHVRLEHIPSSQDKDQFTSDSKHDLSGSYGSHTQVSC